MKPENILFYSLWILALIVGLLFLSPKAHAYENTGNPGESVIYLDSSVNAHYMLYSIRIEQMPCYVYDKLPDSEGQPEYVVLGEQWFECVELPVERG